MLVIRDPLDAANVADPELRHLIEKTVRELSEDYPYDPDELGYFLIVQPGDRLDTLSRQIGFHILVNRFSGIKFGHAGFTPSFELVDEHAGYYEMVFILSDDGFGVEVFIPKTEGVDPDLLAMCKKYAVTGGV
ncbi:MAG TPA: hypothetical protein VIK56_08660 [Rhodoferax sp.]